MSKRILAGWAIIALLGVTGVVLVVLIERPLMLIYVAPLIVIGVLLIRSGYRAHLNR